MWCVSIDTTFIIIIITWQTCVKAVKVGVPGISSLALRNPFVTAFPRRLLPKPPLLSLSTEDRLRAQLVTVLAGSSEDLLESSLLRHASGQECAVGDTAVED